MGTPATLTITKEQLDAAFLRSIEEYRNDASFSQEEVGSMALEYAANGRSRATSAITPDSPEGREIVDFLTEKLNLPKGLAWLEVRLAVREPITVRCEFTPEAETKGEGEGKSL